MKKMNNWWKKSTFYEIYPQSFKDSNDDGIGDINGIIESLDYIKGLGVSGIWITPIYKSPMVDNGYDISNYTEINPDYGTMSDFDNLLELAHQKNLKIIMDLVVNHTSDQHHWFKESKKSKNNPYSDYYIWRDPSDDGSAPSNLGSVFGGSAWEYVPERQQYYLHLFEKRQPDLNWESRQLRKDIYSTMKFWLNKGIDGFRMDSISFISKDPLFQNVEYKNSEGYGAYYIGSANGPKLHEYLQEMNQEILSNYDVVLIGETPHTTSLQAQKYVDPDRKELNMLFQFDHMHVDYGEFGRYSDVSYKLSDLRSSMSEWQNNVAWNALYLNNHDQPRSVSRFGDDYNYRKKSAEMLAAITFLQRGTPFIFQGEEIGMTNCKRLSIDEYQDVEAYNNFENLQKAGLSDKKALEMINRKSRDNSRTPMQWSTDKNAGFSNYDPWISVNPNYKEINTEKDKKSEDSIYYFYKKLIAIRGKNDVLINGSFQLLSEKDSDIFAYIRSLDNKEVLVIGSFSNKKIKYRVPSKIIKQKSKLLLSNYLIPKHSTLETDIYMEPFECLVYQLSSK